MSVYVDVCVGELDVWSDTLRGNLDEDGVEETHRKEGVGRAVLERKG